MPGGTGDEVPVAATSKRLIGWPAKTSPLGCHHSGATCATGPAGTYALPVENQVLILYAVTSGFVDSLPVDALQRYERELYAFISARHKELWDELTDAQYLRVYVRQLRQKIESDPENPQFVLTETGIGYRLRAAD